MEVAGKTEETDPGELWREREEREGGGREREKQKGVKREEESKEERKQKPGTLQVARVRGR